jgi:hypothetical protein
VRATLVNASHHPGIATNAGMHNITAPDCPFCTRGVRAERHSVVETFNKLEVSRTYTGLNPCPLDAMPDLFFREQDNPGFALVSPLTEELSHPIAQVMESTSAPESDTVTIKVYVADHAASAELAAEVEVGGQWFPAKAVGATADPLGTALMLPLDANRDGIADAWSSRHGGGTASEDRDGGWRGKRLGDGLTLFEEYRGFYQLGAFARTDPRTKDLFVTDYTHTHRQAIVDSGTFYAGHGVAVHEVDGTEFRSDVINWQPADQRQSPQYLVAIMTNPATPAAVGWRDFTNEWLTIAGVASHVNPPERGHSTVILQYENKRVPDRTELGLTVAHELGHMMGLPHHGSGDGFLDETPDPAGVTHRSHYAAVRGGQHSGDQACIMRYGVADLLCKAPALVPYSAEMYDPWMQPANAGPTLCATRSGTGINAGGLGAGDASAGNCLAELRVKSGQR